MANELVSILVGGPQRETGVWNEATMWLLISGLKKSINLMTIFYDYFIVSHPTVVLCMYLFLYCCLAKYIVDLGRLLSKAEQFQWNGIDFVEPSLVPTKRVRYKKEE